VLNLLKLTISGIDRIGKTQQIQLLGLGTSKITHRLKQLIEYGDGWPALSKTAFHEWWFDHIEFDALVRIIINGLKVRNDSCVPNKINIFDRGTLMFKAVLAATYTTKDLGSLEDAYDRVDDLFDDLLGYSPDEYELLLVPDIDYQRSIKPLIQIVDIRNDQYTSEQTARYTTYQKYLDYAIKHYYIGMPHNQNVVVSSCLFDIQNEIRSRYNNAIGIKLPIICESFERAIALGGLSESGKSSLGEILSKQYGFYRLKLRYFEDILIRTGQTVNANNMGFEFTSFLHCHPHITQVSIESMHDPILPAYLKLLLADRFTIVFLTAPEELRISRTANGAKMSIEKATTQVRQKDEIKRSRGAHQVEAIADLVFSNITDGVEIAASEFAKQLCL